jgi:hypothetical protein
MLDEVQNVDGQLILNFKKLLQIIFPSFDIEIVDGLINTAIQGNLKPMIPYFPRESPYSPIFRVIFGVTTKDPSMTLNSMMDLL